MAINEKHKKTFEILIFILVGIVIGAISVYSYYGLNVFQLKKERSQVFSKEKNFQGKDSEELLTEAAAYLKFKEIKNSFIPKGVPDIYGKELNISFDKVQDAINKVAPFDLTYGQRKIALSDSEMKRYIDIGSKISCEFCCGAKTLVFKNGDAACSCDHSQMMRGLTAYLIKNHPNFSDEQILKELWRWKISFFPKQTLTRELNRRQKLGEPGINEILKEFPEFLPQMVGGC